MMISMPGYARKTSLATAPSATAAFGNGGVTRPPHIHELEKHPQQQRKHD